VSKAPRAANANRDWGSDESGTPIMHIDMDAFFAACELARRPELRGLPVIVGGGHRGVVLAATYEARAFGVRSAMTMHAAYRACPQAVIVPPDHRLYGQISDSIIEMLYDITPKVEQVSIDEAFMDVSGALRLLGPPTVIGARLRAQVAATHGVTCSVGIARNKFVAKVASTHAKPDGMILIPDDATEAFLRELPAGALWGVGEKTEATLARWGITGVAQIADLDLNTLQMMLGKASGYHLHCLAKGIDPRPVVNSTPEKSIGNETTFYEDQADPEIVAKRLLALCDKVAGRLRKQGYVAGTVAVKVRTSDFHTVSKSKTLRSPTDVAHEIFPVAKELVESVDLNGLPVRLIGVRAERLTKRTRTSFQDTLEEANSPSDFRQAELALDQVRAKFGSGAVKLGAT
jgi:DNA polymerase IV